MVHRRPPDSARPSPPALFPSGLQGPGQPATGFPTSNPLKFLQNIRLSDDHLFGDSGNSGDMRINDAFATTTIAFPNFFWTGQPWFLSPGFGYHAWSGPFGTWTDDGGVAQLYPQLPPDAYSAFLDIGWRSSPDRAFGAELGGRIGVYSDFDSIDDQSDPADGLGSVAVQLDPHDGFERRRVLHQPGGHQVAARARSHVDAESEDEMGYLLSATETVVLPDDAGQSAICGGMSRVNTGAESGP